VTYWILLVVNFVIAYFAYTMIVNRAFLRCPHCRKIGSWRFDDIDSSDEEHDENGDLVRSSTRQKCRGCGGEVISTWSDIEGRAIQPVLNRLQK